MFLQPCGKEGRKVYEREEKENVQKNDEWKKEYDKNVFYSLLEY